jgi:AraC-like DNA-binding protein
MQLSTLSAIRFVDLVFVYHLRDDRQIAWHGRLHSHGKGHYEFHYFVGGAGLFKNGDRTHTIAPGSLHVTPPELDHQIIATDSRKPITYYAILFETREQELITLLDEQCSRDPEPFKIGTSHRFFFADLLERHFSGKHELMRSAEHAFISFLFCLAAGFPSSHAQSENVHVEKALAIMQSSLDKNLDLAEVCNRISLSQEYFVRVFSERMGTPPMKYFAHLKVEAARAMLSSTNLRIQQIADNLGYTNQFNFARAFKRLTGQSPSQYRTHALQRADFTQG